MDLTTGYPYWLINSGLPVAYPKLEKSIKTDVLIIGGGISGALTAYYLIQAGINCLLVDQRTIGLGSTCASTSLLQYELDIPLYLLTQQIGEHAAKRAYELCYESINTLEYISKKIKFGTFEKQKSLYFSAKQKDYIKIETEFLYRKKAGFDVQLLDRDTIKNKCGFSAPNAILSTRAAVTDAYLFTHALLQESIKNGLQAFDRTGVSEIDYQQRSVTVTTEKGYKIHAKKIVNASGYEIAEFINKKIVSLHSTYAVASEQMHIKNLQWKEKYVLWNTADPYLYIRLTSDNRIIVGGRDEDFYNPKKRDKNVKHKTQLLETDFLKLFPQIDFKSEYSWAGTFGSTKDALPYIGMYSKTPHTYYALGFGGNGITFSVIAAELICDMILGKKNNNAALFSFNR
jgi:glycine/D-amino acid oxidase-like deaminating enzyme